MAKLNTYVPVNDSSGSMHLFGPDDVIPEWAVAIITNPDVWADKSDDGDRPESEETSEETEVAIELVVAGVEDAEIAEAVDGVIALAGNDSAAAEAALPVPAKAGPNAKAATWAAYAVQEITARGLNIDIPADATRTDIIEALTNAGIPTE